MAKQPLMIQDADGFPLVVGVKVYMGSPFEVPGRIVDFPDLEERGYGVAVEWPEFPGDPEVFTTSFADAREAWANDGIGVPLRCDEVHVYVAPEVMAS